MRAIKQSFRDFYDIEMFLGQRARRPAVFRIIVFNRLKGQRRFSRRTKTEHPFSFR